MASREKITPYKHHVAAMTVGDLAKALGVPADVPLAYPPDTKLVVSTLREPSTEPGTDMMEDNQFVVTYVELTPDWIPPTRVDGKWVDGYHREPGTTLVLGTDWESGDYEKSEPGW